MNDFKLLDCTLRDGGYINGWNWSYGKAREIIKGLVRAKIDVVEVGFLRNVDAYNSDITVCNRIDELNKLLPEDTGDTMFAAMAMRSNYDIEKLNPYNGEGIELIRITAHDYDIKEGLDFAREVKERGYKLSINPINIMGYSDEMILQILNQVNEIHPYQFSIVDTFGSMKRRDLDRIVGLVDNNLSRDIRVALHLHENMSLSSSLAQRFIDFHLNRPTSVDGSLMGIGRVPGNLPIELIADYLNEYADAIYDIDALLDTIEDFIAPLHGNSEWGYTPAYFLSARFNLHRNYAEFFLKKGNLTVKDINHILARIFKEKATVFDEIYAESLYIDYQSNSIDDSGALDELKRVLYKKKILLMAPGQSIELYETEIVRFIKEKNPVVIAVNFVPNMYKADYVIFGNQKRYDRLSEKERKKYKVIVTSNLHETEADYVLDYNNLSRMYTESYNSFIMTLVLLKDLGKREVYVAGADGFSMEGKNYYDSGMNGAEECGERINQSINEVLRRMDLDITYITPSKYENYRVSGS